MPGIRNTSASAAAGPINVVRGKGYDAPMKKTRKNRMFSALQNRDILSVN
jgi:hypothetical protein